MSDPETINSSQENSWFFIRGFYWIAQKAKSIFGWLFLKQEDYGENESGEIIRRSLMNKSWFDKISSTWVEQPFWIKLLVFTGSALLSGLIGLWIGSPILLALSTLFIEIVIHMLFVAHEHHRIEHAKIFAAEAIELNEDLRTSKDLLHEAANTVGYATTEINGHSIRMKDNAEELAKESQAIFEHHDVLTSQVDELIQVTSHLAAQEKEVIQVFEQTVLNVEHLNDATKQTKAHLHRIGDAAAQFTVVVEGIQSSQIAYADAVARFGIFVDNQHICNKPAFEEHSLNFITELTAELDENDRLIAQIQEFK